MTSTTKSTHDWIEGCQGLVRSLALKVHRNLPSHIDLDDLISYGQIGLAEAARDFDPQRGGEFTTFAYYRIRGAIYDGLSKMSWVKRSQYQRLKYEQMANDVLRLEHENSADAPAPTPDDDARWLKGVTSALAVVYLSTARGGDGEEEALEVEDRSVPAPSAAAIDRELHQRLRQVIEELPAEARTLIQATYFEGLTLTEAGQRIGVGKAWASRLHAKTLERLARSLRMAGVAG